MHANSFLPACIHVHPKKIQVSDARKQLSELEAQTNAKRVSARAAEADLAACKEQVSAHLVVQPSGICNVCDFRLP